VLPIVSLVVTGEAYGFLLWPILAFCWWAAGYEQRWQARRMPKPRSPTFPGDRDL
jgi:hypothetical protein